MCFGHELYQIAVAELIFAQQGEMIRVTVHGTFFLEAGARCHINFAADDRFNARSLRSLKKLYCTVQYTVIGDCHSGLPLRLDRRDQIFDTAGAVQQGILGMNMKMHKRLHKRHLLFARYRQKWLCYNRFAATAGNSVIVEIAASQAVTVPNPYAA